MRFAPSRCPSSPCKSVKASYLTGLKTTHIYHNIGEKYRRHYWRVSGQLTVSGDFAR
jgi:hypothetical protein